MDYEKIFISKGLRAQIVYSEKANMLMLYSEYQKHKDDILNTSFNGTLKDVIDSNPS